MLVAGVDVEGVGGCHYNFIIGRRDVNVLDG